MILAVKLLLVPMLIWGITLAGRRWGPAVGGWLSAFPILSAPILFIIAIQHGTAFAASAALSTLTAVLGNLAFGLCYAWSATRFFWGLCLLAGFAGYFLVIACLYFLAPSIYVAVPLVMAVLLIAPRLYPASGLVAQTPSTPANDLFWRMGSSVLLVLLVTHFSEALGSQLSGAFAMFPMMAPVLAVFSHRQSGSGYATRLLRGMVLGYYSFSVFCIALVLALPATSLGFAFTISLGSAVLVQALSRLLLLRSQPPVSGELAPPPLDR
jgi:hypothetical protein